MRRGPNGRGLPRRPDRTKVERMSFIEVISPIEDVIEEARNGRMFILVDDEDLEDEADLVIPGTMARAEDVVRSAQLHGLTIPATPDRIAYRRRHDRIVERRLETVFESKYGGQFKMYIYVNTVAHVEHIALVKGDISTPEPIPVRMHALNVLDDVLGSSASGRGGVLQSAMEMIAGMGRGVVVWLREALPTSLLDRMRGLVENGRNPVPELRDYGVGAQILLDLGVREMILLSNTHRTIVGLDGYGLTVVEERRIVPAAR